MKKEMYDYLGIPFPKKEDFRKEVDLVENSDPNKAILESIYALDPITRLPTGDIMCYMSSSTPSEIKQYILDNLMIDVSSQALPPLPDGLDEDSAFVLERKFDESVEQYRQRISEYMEQQVNIRDMAIENAKREETVSESAE